MRRTLLIGLLVFSLLVSALPPQIGESQGPSVPTNGLIIDEHWVDINVLDDHTTIQVDEIIFFNNSGTDTFNGTIYAWVPEGSIVRSTCCGNALDMGCRKRDFGAMDCFNIIWQDDNVIYGNPIIGSKLISYFGQKATITIDAQSQNYSDSDSIDLNVTVGNISEDPKTVSSDGPGIHVTSNVTELGAMTFVTDNMPVNLTITQSLNVTNNGTGNDTIDLDILGLPSGWGGALYYEGNEVNSIAINLTENKSVTLQLKIPSYLFQIWITYTVGLPSTEQERLESFFEKELLYDNDRVVSYIYTDLGTNLTTSGGMSIHFSTEMQNKTLYVITGYDLSSGSLIGYTFSWEIESDLSWLILILAVIIFAILVAVATMVKRKKTTGESSEEGDKLKDEEVVAKSEGDSSEDSREDLIKQKKSTDDALKKLDEDHKSGLLPDSTYFRMKKRLARKNLDLKKKLERSEVGSVPQLEEQKDKMLKAIKQLDKELESGKISSDVHDELYGEYKKRTIEIMREIDKHKKG